MQRQEYLHMSGVTKRFPGVTALDDARFELSRGEVHALLGENGAGKTTLMNILYGIYRPDAGSIRIDGSRVDIHSPHDAIGLGIGMVSQNFRLVAELTVWENIFLSESRLPFLIKESALEEEVAALASRYGLSINPGAKIWQLSVGEQQRVEILKLFRRRAGILILDEPTSVLTPQETENLFKMIRQLAREGKSVIFISHKLDEVLGVSDRITVFRRGKTVATAAAGDVSKQDLARMMVGRDLPARTGPAAAKTGRAVLRIRNLRVHNDRKMLAVNDVSCDVHEGEIMGLAGIAGNGQKELAEAVMGLHPLTGGSIEFKGQQIQRKTVRQIIEMGIAYIPEIRLGRGLVPEFDVAQNLILKEYRTPKFSSGLLLRWKEIRKHCRAKIGEFSIVAPPKKSFVVLLSGGNLQKVILARELSSGPRLIIAHNPTFGLDIGAVCYIHELFLEQKRKGTAILLISEELEELLELSDRIGIMHRGTLTGVVDPKNTTRETIGLLMGGEKQIDAAQN